MLQENLIRIYEQSFRDNRELPALTDYFKKETFSYYEMANEIAKLHLLFGQCNIQKGDKIAIIDLKIHTVQRNLFVDRTGIKGLLQIGDLKHSGHLLCYATRACFS